VKGEAEYGFQLRLLMTGTPLQNNTQELWSLLNFIEPRKFPDMEKFQDRFGDIKSPEQVMKSQTVFARAINQSTDIARTLRMQPSRTHAQARIARDTVLCACFVRSQDVHAVACSCLLSLAAAALARVKVRALQRRLEPHLLRRVKEDVATDIPAKEETIIDVELTTLQKQCVQHQCQPKLTQHL